MISESGIRLPERIGRLNELANNLWWSWNEKARSLFRALDYSLWRLSGHNPVKQLLEITPDKFQIAANDPVFLALYDAVITDFDTGMSPAVTWCAGACGDLLEAPVAYFSAEFAIHRSLPMYAGGLGVLAGDICKEASDLGLPMVAVGFMYPQGYFQQHISAEGWQEETYQQINFAESPINQCGWPASCGSNIEIELGGKTLRVGAWLVKVGLVNMYLLDTDIEGNSPEDRQLTARLYTADREQRIQQEIILGIGGVRVLRALGVKPAIWHANEGHTTFMTLERVREEIVQGATFREAQEQIKKTTVFTTHTPVPAGHDVFSAALVEKYFHNYWQSLNLSFPEFMQLGQANPDDNSFNMTVLGLKMADYRNAVSRIHADVSRKMWHGLWPELTEEQVPISYVTNGVHLPTWIAPELLELLSKNFGSDFIKKYDNPEECCNMLENIPDADLWEIRQTLKRKLVQTMLEYAQRRWAEGKAEPKQVLAMGALLDVETLTLGFCRRFTEYKRPSLIFHDIERLKKIINNRQRPVQIIFAGKSHPADYASKFLLHHVYSLATDREFQGRIVFVEDYDMHSARYLIQGVDVWLNNPRRLQEACGTSGMKAGLNGLPQLSVLDGWWNEGFNGKNGWAITGGPEVAPAEQDNIDAESLYRLLEEEIIPLFYERDRSGVPHGWMNIVKQSMRSIITQFTARRMLKEYISGMYVPITQYLKAPKPN